MLVKRLIVGERVKANCYFLWREGQFSCAVIDPGYDGEKIIQTLEEMQLKCSHILVTHGHYDHTMAVDMLHATTGAPIYVAAQDVGVKLGNRAYIFKPKGPFFALVNGTVLEAGGLEIHVLATPGHSPGSVTFLCENALFTGDVLMAGTCGATNFSGGDGDKLAQSLAFLSHMEGNYLIYPGHGEPTSLQKERDMNPYLRRALQGKAIWKGVTP